jgi:hypothetical protein
VPGGDGGDGLHRALTAQTVIPAEAGIQAHVWISGLRGDDGATKNGPASSRSAGPFAVPTAGAQPSAVVAMSRFAVSRTVGSPSVRSDRRIGVTDDPRAAASASIAATR